MASPTPLTGLELVDCARANAKQGVETTAQLCGYGTNLEGFRHALEEACQHMRIEFHELSDLIKDQQIPLNMGGIEVAPDTNSQL
jgi:hypothetical protein